MTAPLTAEQLAEIEDRKNTARCCCDLGQPFTDIQALIDEVRRLQARCDEFEDSLGRIEDRVRTEVMNLVQP